MDHFSCYHVQRSRNAAKFGGVQSVPIADEMGSHVVNVRPLQTLGLPADLDGEEPGAATHVQALMCYRPHLYHRVDPPDSVFASNDFADHRFTVRQRVDLCVPSIVTP